MEDLLGKQIENYRIDSVLGRGGMGIVYRAYDEKLDRYVAIKVLAVKVVDKERFIERFKREAKNHAQLSHPNIVTVYGFIEYEDLLGIVMEYVDGESLERVLFKHTRLHVYDVVYILRQVLEGIGYAHSKGFVHRDIKPSNIILNSEGTVKIMDFGISKSLVDRSMTSTGSKVGTVYYMSPEQIKGDDVNHLTDIYAIGCTMYEMIFGKPPFYSETEYDIMDGHLNKDYQKLSELMPGIPPTINEVANICLMKNPTERYQYCEHILQKFHELDEYMKDVKSNYFIRTKKDPKKTKMFSIFATSGLVVVLAALFYFVYVQVGELLQSDLVEKFREYSFDSMLGTDNEGVITQDFVSLSKGTKRNLNSLALVTDSFAIAVGDSGTIIRTNDNAATWETVEFGEAVTLNDILTFENGNGFIVGNNSTIIKSNNFFDTFELLTLSQKFNLISVEFIDGYTGFIVGGSGLILRSTDSGETWSSLRPNTEETLFDIHFLNGSVGFAVGWNGTILKTDDAGLTWVKQSVGTNKYLRAIDFWEDRIGLICGGAGTILRTSNTGDNWEVTEIGGLVGFNDVKFLNENTALVIGNKGTIMVSKDGGESWKKLANSNYANLSKINISPLGDINIAGINGTILQIEAKSKD